MKKVFVIMFALLCVPAFAQMFPVAEYQPIYRPSDSIAVVDTSRLYYCSYDSTDVANLNKAINDSLTSKVKGYSASRYSTVYRHPDRPEWAIGIDKGDLRDPLRFITEQREAMLNDRTAMIKRGFFNN